MAEEATGYVEGQIREAAEKKQFSSRMAEENVLLLMLTRADKVKDEVLGSLGPGDFADAEHRMIFEAMARVAGDGGRIDPVSVDDAFSRLFPDAADRLRQRMVGLMEFKPG